MSTIKSKSEARIGASSAPIEEDFRKRQAKVKRDKMLARLLSATMEVCIATESRGPAVIDHVVKAAGVSRGAFYWYFDSLNEAIEMLGRRLADEMVEQALTACGVDSNPVVRAAKGGHVLMTRALMDRSWGSFVSNVHIMADDSSFVKAVRQNLEHGRAIGIFKFESLTIATDFQIGAVFALVRRACGSVAPSRDDIKQLNFMILRGLGVDPQMALSIVNEVEKDLDTIGPGLLPWWRDIP